MNPQKVITPPISGQQTGQMFEDTYLKWCSQKFDKKFNILYSHLLVKVNPLIFSLKLGGLGTT